MIEILPTPADVATVAARVFLESYQVAVSTYGRFVVALSGGSTPKALHAILAAAPYRDQIDWPLVHFLFGDERYVPPTDDQSNEKMARMTLLSLVPVLESQVHGMYAEGGARWAASRYEEILREVLGPDLAIDLTLLGLGPDGHTASLFPGRGAVHETERLVISAKANVGVEDRITMTVPLLNRSRKVLFLAAGQDKVDAVYRAIEGPESWDETPSQAVARHATNVAWIIDEAASARLT